MNLRDETRFIMNKYGISASKRLGQNFLIDDNAVDEIVRAAEISKEDFVIEIGPGLGTLTAKLVQHAGKVTCVELDDRMISILSERFALYDNFELIHDDILKIDISKLIAEAFSESDGKLKHAKVVANLPYYITTPIIMKLLKERLNLQSITIMVQKEVANRLVAEPGSHECGAITYSIYYYTTPTKCIDVSKYSFVPSPEVDSAVIKLNLLSEPRIQVEDEQVFFNIIKAAFMQKRKTLINALFSAKLISSKDEGEKMLTELGFDPNIRGEKLSLNDYKRIYDYLKTK